MTVSNGVQRNGEGCDHREQSQPVPTDWEGRPTEVKHMLDDQVIRRDTDLSSGALSRGLKQFSWSTAIVHYPLISANELIKVDISSLPNMRHQEVSKFSPFVFKDGDDALTSQDPIENGKRFLRTAVNWQFPRLRRQLLGPHLITVDELVW